MQEKMLIIISNIASWPYDRRTFLHQLGRFRLSPDLGVGNKTVENDTAGCNTIGNKYYITQRSR